MNQSCPPPDAAAQAFLDTALDRILRAWSAGHELTADELAAERPDLRAEIEELVTTARGTALVRPQPLPRVPGYDVLHEIGRGGMGIVYAARQLGLDRLVALKVLPEFVAGSERARRRFLAEARGLAKVRHPHVVTIVDVFETGSLLAYAMEWIDGKSLADVLAELGSQRRDPSVPEISFGRAGSERLPRDPMVWFCRLGIAIARALAEVHRCGLVHRDVKPSNILLRADGTPLLSDFGLVHDTDTSLTRSGQIVGTLAFAPPEQLAGANERIGPPSDVFALGAMLHLALAGSPAFPGQSAVELCASIEARRRQPLTKLGLPRDLETVVGKCLEPRMADRYATADAVAADLENVLALRPIAARPIAALPRLWRLARRNRRAVVAAGLAALVMALVTVLATWQVAARLTAPIAFKEHLRNAHAALLREFYDEGPGRDATRPRTPTDRLLQRTTQALGHFDLALQCSDDLGAAREREVVALADGVLARMAAASGTRPDHYALAERLPLHLASDPRLRGLYAFLLDDLQASTEAWAELDLVPGAPDPLVDGALGQALLARGNPAAAYMRLTRAFDEMPQVGLLAVALADCMVQVGEFREAKARLQTAERLGAAGMRCAWVRANMLAAQGDTANAKAAYEAIVWHPQIHSQEPTRLRHIELLQREREFRPALERLLELVEFGTSRPEHGPQLAELAALWWQSMSVAERSHELLLCWNNDGGWPLLQRLASTESRMRQEYPERSTVSRSATSPERQRQAWSMSTLPLEFTMTKSQIQRWIRHVPPSLQRLAAAMFLASESQQGRALAKVTPSVCCMARLGSVYGVAVLGFVLSALSPTPPAQVQWVSVSPGAAAPTNRINMTGVFDPANGLVLAYGGYTHPGFHDDLWAWNGSQRTWSLLSSAAGLLSRYDAAISQETNNRLIIFGGHPNGGTTDLADTWRWNGSTWSQLTPANSPPPRHGSAMAFDSHRGVVALFGGIRTGTILGDTWEWNGSNWSQINTPSSPMARYQHAMTYDTVRQRVLMFGGAYHTRMSNDTYEWDGSSWLLRSVAVSPTPRQTARLIWDSGRSRAVLFGGYAQNGSLVYELNDLWEWDGSTWTQRMAAGPQIPSARYAMLMVYDPIRRETVMFGGGIYYSVVHLGDTWILAPVVHADVSSTGPGCAGVLGTPTVTAASGSLPWLGDTLDLEITGLPRTLMTPILVAGFTNPGTAGLFCRPDCTLLASPDASYLLTPAGNNATWSLAIPNVASLLGGTLFAQAVTFDVAAGCIDSMSNGVQITIGGR
ncbi:MAG: protein kinase [Planctomycetes bacterium]|nr:protein kinase [Planctomycetota bacterium]